jgi:hypothetical protein
MYYVALSLEEIDGFISHLFDKGVPTARPDSAPLPYSSDNRPPSVRVLASFNLFSICDSMNLFYS